MLVWKWLAKKYRLIFCGGAAQNKGNLQVETEIFSEIEFLNEATSLEIMSEFDQFGEASVMEQISDFERNWEIDKKIELMDEFCLWGTKLRGINDSDEVKMPCGVDIISRALFP